MTAEGGLAQARDIVLDLPDEDAMRVFGADLALVLGVGDRVALRGNLGAGKSTLARALIRAAAGDDALEVPSPTYTLVQTYETRPKITHLDLYRIASEDEVEELGFDEAAETGIVLVEWPDRSSRVLDECNLVVSLDISAAGGRTAVLGGDAEILGRVGRSLRIRDFLRRSGAGAVRRMPFPADASARRYERIGLPGAPDRILMDAPRAERSGAAATYAATAHIAADILPFVAIGERLAAMGFSAPRIHAHDLPAGLVLLEDLGAQGVLGADGAPDAERYVATAEALASLHDLPFDPEVRLSTGETYEIPTFDRAAMQAELSLMPDWYMPARNGAPVAAPEREAFVAIWDRTLDGVADAQTHLLLRDVHSPNLLWQADRTGHARVGLIDFQDAMIGPTAYDLASLGQDARVDVPADLEKALLAAYLAARANIDETRFRHAYAVMAAQRATKILGIFVRLHERDGKAQYRRHIPRLQRYLTRTLEHPELGALKNFYQTAGVLDVPGGES